MKYECRKDDTKRGQRGKTKDPHQIEPDDTIMTSKLWSVPEKYPAFKAWREGIDWGRTS
jgi:hypothetical protein